MNSTRGDLAPRLVYEAAMQQQHSEPEDTIDSGVEKVDG